MGKTGGKGGGQHAKNAAKEVVTEKEEKEKERRAERGESTEKDGRRAVAPRGENAEVETRKKTERKEIGGGEVGIAKVVEEKRAEVERGEIGRRTEGEDGNKRQKEMKNDKYEQELTLAAEMIGEGRLTVMELIRGVQEACGAMTACRYTGQNKYEITMSHPKGKQRLLDGMRIGPVQIITKELCNDELVVSFLGLPAYITDEVILNKLSGWGVKAVSPITRRLWPGTRIADGTRFVKVKFTETIQSLPYSAKFDTALGPEYFRVIHDKQVKVCRMCIQPGHILRECPEFQCRKCGEQGHYARECWERAERCRDCKERKKECVCGEVVRSREEVAEMTRQGETRMMDGGTDSEEAGQEEEVGAREKVEVTEEEREEPRLVRAARREKAGRASVKVGVSGELEMVTDSAIPESEDSGEENRREGSDTESDASGGELKASGRGNELSGSEMECHLNQDAGKRRRDAASMQTRSGAKRGKKKT